MTQFSKVCFTLNNYTEEEYIKLQEWDAVSYIILGKEVGAEGTPHIQGYAELTSRKRMTTLKKFNPRIHWESLKSTGLCASNYCKKDGDYWEKGELKKPTEKREMKDWIDMVKTKKMRGILENPPSMSVIRVMEKYLTYLEPMRNTKPTVYWLWGASGCGKSKKAQEMAGEDVYWKDGEKWWDGYDGQKTIIIDDFRASNMKFNYLLRILDRYPMRVEVKGGYRQLNSDVIIITTIVHYSKCYQNLDNEPLEQLKRRIDFDIECNRKDNDFISTEINMSD